MHSNHYFVCLYLELSSTNRKTEHAVGRRNWGVKKAIGSSGSLLRNGFDVLFYFTMYYGTLDMIYM